MPTRIADIAVFAYASRAEDAGFELRRIRTCAPGSRACDAQPGHLAQMHPYSMDPHSVNELA